jgi:hypothetical protein
MKHKMALLFQCEKVVAFSPPVVFHVVSRRLSLFVACRPDQPSSSHLQLDNLSSFFNNPSFFSPVSSFESSEPFQPPKFAILSNCPIVYFSVLSLNLQLPFSFSPFSSPSISSAILLSSTLLPKPIYPRYLHRQAFKQPIKYQHVLPSIATF